jgi:hypothetical protein
MHATGISFKMAYRRPELKELEGSRAGPEPQFGTYKNESDNGDTENCLHWSTLMHEELSFAVENEVVNRSTQDSKLQAGPMFPEEIGVIFGLDHGQGALRGYAKFLRAVRHTIADKQWIPTRSASTINVNLSLRFRRNFIPSLI